MELQSNTIQRFYWEVPDSSEEILVVFAGCLYAVSGVVALFVGLMGLAALDPVRISFLAPTGLLLSAAALMDARRRWTLRLGALSGFLGLLVWCSVLLDAPVWDFVSTAPLLFFAVACWMCARALARLARPGSFARQPPPADAGRPEVGWIEEDAQGPSSV